VQQRYGFDTARKTRADRTANVGLPARSDSPLARIGPIKGEMSIAPMITAGLFKASPSVAIPAEKRT
jgi:hypothetical protein